MSFTPEQLEARRSTLGASEAAAALGLSPWKTPFQLWQEKKGLAEPQEESEPMYWGSALENAILSRYIRDNPTRTIGTRCATRSHVDFPWMTCTPDADCGDRVVEAKTARTAEGWGEPGSAEIPQHYMTQVQHQMSVMGYPVADVPVLIGGSDYRVYTVPADQELQALIIEGEHRFWRDHVLANVAPEPVDLADVRLKYGRQSVAQSLDADARLQAFYEELKDIQDKLKELDARQDLAKLEIMKAMGERDTLMIGGKVACTWKASKAPLKFDVKAFEAAYPDIFKQFQKLGEPSRRFLTK